MLNKQDIKQRFLDGGLKESSSLAYANGLCTIINKLKGGETEHLEKPTASWFSPHHFKEEFSFLKPTTQRNYISSVIGWMKLNNEVPSTLFTELSAMRDALNGSYKRRIESGEKTPHEDSLWVPIQVLSDVFEEKVLPMLKRLNLDGSKRKPVGNYSSYDKKDLEKIRDHIILAVYLYPFYDLETNFGVQRNIACTYKFFPVTGRAKKINYPDDNSNYFVSKPGSGYLYMQAYKTVNTHGKEEIPLPNFLSSMLRKWAIFRDVKSGELLFEGLTKHSITQILQKLMGRYTGKNISSQMLRKIYLTHRFEKDQKNREETAKSMGHSVETQGAIYVKSSKKEKK